jgi:hypothetical protein
MSSPKLPALRLSARQWEFAGTQPAVDHLPLHGRHEVVESVFRKTEPQHLVALEVAHVGVDFLPLRVPLIVDSKNFLRRRERRRQDGLRKRQYLGLDRHQLLQRDRV